MESLTFAGLLPYLGTFLIGLSKAGFATGLGMLTTPLLATSMPPREALGVVLPLLCLADIMTLVLYWRKWDFSMIKNPVIGCAIGVVAGIFFVNSISPMVLKMSIGITGIALTILLVIRRFTHPDHIWKPTLWAGLGVGVAAGFSSTISHGAGPIVALYLMAQKPDKMLFVATSALYFFIGNWMKVPPYLAAGLINPHTLWKDLLLLPILPLGVGAGWLFNKYIPQKGFDILVWVLLFITSLDLVIR